jgi:parallel beta-helix repeat protein
MRRALILAAAMFSLLVFGVGQAASDPVTLDLTEPAELPVDPSTLVTYPAALPGLGEVLADPLAVTDAELAAVGSVNAPASFGQGSPDFVVDDDFAQCPNADFGTAAGIQLAVGAAPIGSTIEVCAGTYTPTVVNKTLVIYHAVQHGQATQCSASLPPDPDKDAIIDAGNTNVIGLTLAANDIVIYGLTVQNTSGNPGIYTLPAFSGYQLLSNVVQLNTFGVYLHNSGATPALVSHNCIRLNNKPGSSSGDGIYSDQGLHNAVVEENYSTGHNVGSMVYALNTTDLTVEHNDVINDNTMVFVDVHNAVAEENHLVNTRGSGIFVGGGVTDLTITKNRIVDPGGTGITTNIQFVAVPNQFLVIDRNHVVGSPLDGIRLNQTDESTVTGNQSQQNTRDGIRLQNDSDFNTIRDNHSRDNGRDGMRVDGGVQSNNNTIETNKMQGNVEHDCHDDTVGFGTALTANFWIDNMGKTENRMGLCKNASLTP